MLFNSVDFAIFLPIVFVLYWFVTNKNLRLQNFLIVVASYFFYGWWDWRYLSLILFSTVVDYTVGRALARTDNPTRRKFLLWTSISVNIGFLGFFKYYNFFLENFISAFSFFGYEFSANSLNIILPVGISFYTFQTLSYTIDVYRKKLEPTRDFIAFAAFVSFFPQLVAGPIERATNLLPQFFRSRKFDYTKAADGLRQILWGLFKKIVVADGCAEYVNLIFSNSADYSGSTLLLGVTFFTIQVYGDFSGYSDIAIGTSRLFGFNLQQNFAFPFFSRDIGEFWRRWHISLSTWFRDYLYIPLGGSRGGTWMNVRNTVIIFVVSGFWHGSDWTYIVWGAYYAVLFIPLLLMKRNRLYLDTVAEGKIFPSLADTGRMLMTFGILVFSLIIFRSNDLGHAWDYFLGIFDESLFSIPEVFIGGDRKALKITLFIVGLFIVEWFHRTDQYALERLGLKWPMLARWSIYWFIIIIILRNAGKEQEFIYFQF